MTSLADLPADHRAVLELVLVRGSNYDEIARLLSVDRAGVRERALAAFDALGPETGVSPERRALITDYLLGQLPERVAGEVSRRLATEPGERAWARVIAGELAGVAAAPLPEIPATNGGAPEAVTEPPRAEAPPPEPPVSPRRPEPRSSRTGGAILLGLAALIAIVVVLVIVLTSGGSGHSRSATTPAATGTPRTTSTGANVHEIYATKLSPVSAGSKALAGAEVVSASGHPFMFVVAENLAANSHNYYAVWLLHGPKAAELVGYDRAAVTSNGKLSALAPLQSDYAKYTQIVLTLQTGTAPGTNGPFPKTPGPTILSGPFQVK